MAYSVIELRAATRKRLNEWIKEKIVDPVVSEGRKLGMTDAEINIALNDALRNSFQGLHKFQR